MKKNAIIRKLGNFVNVSNMCSRTGEAPNQFILTFDKGSIFKSYDTIIAVKTDDGELYLDPKHFYSKTTNRYCLDFCGLNIAERRKALVNGCTYDYRLVKEINLN